MAKSPERAAGGRRSARPIRRTGRPAMECDSVSPSSWACFSKRKRSLGLVEELRRGAESPQRLWTRRLLRLPVHRVLGLAALSDQETKLVHRMGRHESAGGSHKGLIPEPVVRANRGCSRRPASVLLASSSHVRSHPGLRIAAPTRRGASRASGRPFRAAPTFYRQWCGGRTPEVKIGRASWRERV